MPLLLNVLRNANTSEYRKLRAKAMECAGLIGCWTIKCFAQVTYTNCQPSRSDGTFSERMQVLSLSFLSEYKVRKSDPTYVIVSGTQDGLNRQPGGPK